MVKRNADMVSEVRERMRDGSGKVEILHIFKKEELKGKARLFARLRLKKGCSIGYHNHEDEEEVFYVICGKGTVTENGKEQAVEAGDAILTGGGSGHSVRNDSDEPLDLVAVILLYS
jgi:quercetin dioxygenase-like cupin family protein